jgi:hypothetical protein
MLHMQRPPPLKGRCQALFGSQSARNFESPGMSLFGLLDSSRLCFLLDVISAVSLSAMIT